jgi:1-acyl-sn-glycerol-3-phosphate acyltransferase
MKHYFLAPLILQKLIWPPTRFILWFFGHLKVKGLENLKDIKGNVIFAPNHASEIDPFLVPASLPFWSRFSPLFYTTREKEFYNTNGWRKHLFGGMFINAWGGYGVKVGLNDYQKSLENHCEIMQDKGSFCVYPEGRRSPDGTIQPAKGGVAYLAECGTAPIVPVAFSGTFRTTFTGFFLRKRHITVYFGKPIYQEELKRHIPRGEHLDPKVYKLEAEYVMEKVREMVEN